MSGFNDFVQTELPKRPFSEADGQAGDVLVRSNNPLAARETVWVPKDTLLASLQSIAKTPITAHRAIAAENGGMVHASSLNPAHGQAIVGVSTKSVVAGEALVVESTGRTIIEPSWAWSSGLPVYVGADGALTQTPPDAPAVFVAQIGVATAPDTILVCIGHPTFL